MGAIFEGDVYFKYFHQKGGGEIFNGGGGGGINQETAII